MVSVTGGSVTAAWFVSVIDEPTGFVIMFIILLLKYGKIFVTLFFGAI